MTITTEFIDVAVADGTTMRAYLARPPGDPAPMGVIVMHELFGVNPDIQSVVDDLAQAGHVALAPEFYHRDIEPGHWLPRDDAGRKDGFALLHNMNRQDALADVAASVDYLRSSGGASDVAVVGFSAGGHLAFLAACQLPITRTAVLYGGWLPTTDIPLSRPEPTLTLAPGITGRLLYLVGQDDTLIDAAQRNQIDAVLTAAGVDHEMVAYPGTGHAFFWPDTPVFNPAARADAWRRILDLMS